MSLFAAVVRALTVRKDLKISYVKRKRTLWLEYLKTKVFTVTCVDLLYISNSQVVQFSTKGSICFTKLLLLCNSVHSYSPKQSPIVFLQLLYKFSWLALNRKSENYPPFRHVFVLQPGMATPISIKRIEPLCLSDSSRMHSPLDNTYHWTFRTK